MGMEFVKIGDNPPEEINVIIEVPKGGSSVKYEMDKDSGMIFVDRLIATPMYYPAHYGFIPHTLSDDGDPLDVLVVEDEDLIPGCVIPVRPVGVLIMEDESGIDEKILAVPTSSIDKKYKDVASYKDLPVTLINQIKHFFEHYKDLEEGKWVKVTGWEDIDSAKKIIESSIKNAQEEKNKHRFFGTKIGID